MFQDRTSLPGKSRYKNSLLTPPVFLGRKELISWSSRERSFAFLTSPSLRSTTRALSSWSAVKSCGTATRSTGVGGFIAEPPTKFRLPGSLILTLPGVGHASSGLWGIHIPDRSHMTRSTRNPPGPISITSAGSLVTGGKSMARSQSLLDGSSGAWTLVRPPFTGSVLRQVMLCHHVG